MSTVLHGLDYGQSGITLGEVRSFLGNPIALGGISWGGLF